MGLVVMTGGTNGFGKVAAERIAAGGHDLILTARNTSTAQRIATDIETRHKVKVTIVALDLTSLAAVRSAGNEIKRLVSESKAKSIETLICNAGGATLKGPVAYSKDGYEETFAVNHLSHFLLVNLLLDNMAPDGRIIITTSGTHNSKTIDGKLTGITLEPDALKLAKNEAQVSNGGVLYTTSKLCNILTSYELQRKLDSAGSHIASIAYNPGYVIDTGFYKTLPPFVLWIQRTSLVRWISKMIGVTIGSLDFSGDSLAALAVDPAYADTSGKYMEANSGTFKAVPSSETSHNTQNAAKLWQDSAKLVDLQENETPKLLSRL